MGRRPLPLPAALGDAFSVDQARRHGVTPAQLRRLPAPFHGVRTRRPVASLVEQCRAATVALPAEAAFAGTTAARLLGLWLPGEWSPEDPVEVVLPSGRRALDLQGVECHSRDSRVVDVDGLAVVSAPDVFAQLAPRLGLVPLVALADSVVRWRSGRDLGQLRDAVRPGMRGARRARQALLLARAGSASPAETRVRLWLLDAGLPEPELNAPVPVGDQVFFGDLVWRDARVIVEYHGGYHFDTAEQRRRDHERLAGFRRAGWTVIEATRRTLTAPVRDDFVDEVAAALGVAPRPRRARGRLLATRRVQRHRTAVIPAE